MKTASGSVENQQESPLAAEAPAKRPARRRWVLVTGVAVVAGVGVAAAAWVIGGDPGKPAAAGAGQVTTATVKRQTLEQHTEVDGRLGFSGSFDVINQAKGTITGLPAVGRVIKSGKVLYRVDGKPVIFLRGDKVPAYRALSQGMRGSDVRQLNTALVGLGYDAYYGPSADSSYFSEATEDAMERLQDAVNVTETGTLALGQAVFLPSDEIRITSKSGTYGGSAPTGQAVLKATSTTPKVSVSIDASQAAHVKAGDKVMVALPNDEEAPGTVRSVGRVATTTEKGSTVPVDVRIEDGKATGGLDAASVKVTIASGEAKDVLAVPVTALLAMSGGGYSVEVVDAANVRRLVKVKIGMFDGAAGMVEVSGPGLTVGQRVVVPAS